MSEEARKEQQYIRMLKKLYQTARKAEPFSDESRDILMSIEALRKTYENEALPVITAINAENVSCFEDLIPADLSEEIAVKKSRAIGILRVGKEDGALTAASSAVFFVEPAAET